MAANKHWPRWILASFSKWFDDHREGIEMYVEGDDPNTAALSDYFEFRTNGPMMEEFSKGFWRLDVVVNLLVVSKRNDRSTHTLPTNLGILSAAFETNIPVYKFGNGVDDDRTVLLGCMVLVDTIEVSQLGQVAPDIKELQAMVQGHYRMFIEVNANGTA